MGMDYFSFQFGLLIPILLTIYVYFYLQPTKRIKKLENFFPGPKPYPFIGNLLSIGFNSTYFMEKLEKIRDEYGRIFRLFIGQSLMVFVSSPEDMEINRNTESKVIGGAWLGEGLLTSRGEKWRRNRKRIMPSFHIKILENFIPVFNKNAQIFIEDLNKFVGGPDFNICQSTTTFTLRNICETALGVNLDFLPDCNAYPKAVEE